MSVSPSRLRRGRSPRGRRAGLALAAALAAAAAGCDNPFSRMDMENQARLKPLEPTPFFADGQSARPLVQNTVARGMLAEDDAFERGVGPDGKELTDFPPQVKVDLELLRRGQERFGITCTPCHGQAGYGDGMVVERGFSRPTSYHIDRLRTAPPGHFYQVITNGYGRMPSYAPQITVRDRWAIVAYVRALQVSQAATPDDLRTVASASPTGAPGAAGGPDTHASHESPAAGGSPSEPAQEPHR